MQKIVICVQLLILSPIIFFIIILRFFLKIQIIEIETRAIGHMSLPIEVYLSEISNKVHKKGICFALDIPLVAIDSLKILAQSQKSSKKQEELILPMFDARRDEVFLHLFDKNFNSVWPTRSQILDESFYDELNAIDKPIIICGDASIKAEELLSNFGPLDQLEFKHNEHPLASYMGEIAQRYLQQNKVEDLAYFEPFYGKDFQAIPSKK